MTQVKTYGGATCTTLVKKLAQFPKCNKVRQVHTHVGFNDTQSMNPMTRTSLALLLDNIKSKFPNAKVTFSAVLPTKYGYLEKIMDFNAILADHCKNKQVKFVDFGSKFLNKPALFSDRDGDNVHLSDKGSDLLLQELKEALGLNTEKCTTGEGTVKAKNDDTKAQANGTDKNPTVQHIETVITSREEQISENHASVADNEAQNQKDDPEIKFVNIEAESSKLGNVFQAFGAQCTSRKDVNKFCETVKQKFRATRDATSFMVAYNFDLDGTKVTGYDNDGENGAGPRMLKMIDIIGMKNVCVVITRHYKGKMFSGRWSIMQEQMSKIASLMGFRVPQSMNIHTFFPNLRNDSTHKGQGYNPAPPRFSINKSAKDQMSDRGTSNFSSNQWNLLQWQLMMQNKLLSLCGQNVTPEGYW